MTRFQELVAPVDGIAKCAVSWMPIAGAIDQYLQWLLHAVQQCRNWQIVQTCCGQFNCERQTIEDLTDLDNCRRGCRRETELRLKVAHALGKQLNSRPLQQRLNILMRRCWIWQRADVDDAFAMDSPANTTRGKDLQARTLGK